MRLRRPHARARSLTRTLALVASGALLIGCARTQPAAPSPDETPSEARPLAAAQATRAEGPIVMLFVGDGMGAEYREMASLIRHGELGALALDGLPVQRVHRSGNHSGVVDSAASATTIATGVATWNGAIGVGADGQARDGLADLIYAQEHDGQRTMGLGLVSTSQLAHATPAAFVAHHPRRGDYPIIAAQMVDGAEADVMLGGGRVHFGDPRETPATGLLARADAHLVGTRSGLEDATAEARDGRASWDRLWGVFDDDHLSWVADGPYPEIPSIAEMTESAIAVLDARFGAWLLVVEGARIDHGGHGNDLRLAMAETLAFDDAVASGLAWAAGRENVSVFVTADHETGGLEWLAPPPERAPPTLEADQPLHRLEAHHLPAHRWRTNAHSNDDVALLASGPCASMVPEGATDHGQLHDVLRACLSGDAPQVRDRLATVDGFVDDLPHALSSAGESTLRARVDDIGLTLGAAAPIAGWEDWSTGDWVLAVDLAPSEATGVEELPHRAPDVPAVNAVLQRARGSFEGCRPDLFAVLPEAAVRAANMYRRDTGAALVLADGASTELPMPWNVGSPAVGRGAADPSAGLEWMLPWRFLFREGRPVGRVEMSVFLGRVARDGSVRAAFPPSEDTTQPFRCAPFSLDARMGGVAVTPTPL